jgi:NADP-dependent 3-hydroxy acid dehydrogenase YdfG
MPDTNITQSSSKIIWISGASSGIGKYTALELAKMGHEVAISARRVEKLEAVCDQAKAKNFTGSIHPYPLDITDRDTVFETVDQIENDLGEIDISILNAGVYEPESIEDFDLSRFDKHIDVNVKGTANTLKPLIDRYIERRRGQLVIVSSVAGYRGLGRSISYGASKATLLHMAEDLKIELDQYNIKTQVVTPGFVKTRLTEKNDFSMPMAITADRAGKYLADGIFEDAFEISFPRKFTFWMRRLRKLPYKLFFPLVKKVTKRM